MLKASPSDAPIADTRGSTGASPDTSGRDARLELAARLLSLAAALCAIAAAIVFGLYGLWVLR